MNKIQTKRIWLIRHGESVANAMGVSSDPSLIPLNETGRAQAELLIGRFTEAPDLIVTSPFIRTTETSQPLRKLYPDIPCEEWPVHEFTYLSPSRCQNTNMTDRKPFVEGYWERADPGYCDGAGAESFNSFLERIRAAISMIESRKESFIAIFTHGQFMCGVKWVLEHGGDDAKICDMTAFRRFIGFLAPKNCEEIELFLK